VSSTIDWNRVRGTVRNDSLTMTVRQNVDVPHALAERERDRDKREIERGCDGRSAWVRHCVLAQRYC